MDVPAVDTSSLAAKRIEMEKVRPVGHKDANSTDIKIAANRRDEKGNPKGNKDDARHSDQYVDEEGMIFEAESTDNDGECHILDAMA